MSTLRVNTLQDQAGTGQPDIDGLCKAWVNFNGSGTVAILGSYNVTSITDNGTGDYTVNFTTAISDANYATNVTASASSGYDVAGYESVDTARTASLVRTFFHNNGSAIDSFSASVTIFR